MNRKLISLTMAMLLLCAMASAGCHRSGPVIRPDPAPVVLQPMPVMPGT